MRLYLLAYKWQEIMNITFLSVYGDSELVVNKIRNQCQDKNPMLRTYINELWELIDNFFLTFNVQFLPREGNIMANFVAIVVRNFKPP